MKENSIFSSNPGSLQGPRVG